MAYTRWISSNRDSSEKPIFYHWISRVVDRRFAFEENEKEKFRMFMRMYENFTDCRVASSCLMCNHFHLLLEVPPMPDGEFSDAELLERLSALYSSSVMADVAKELAEDREAMAKRRGRDWCGLWWCTRIAQRILDYGRGRCRRIIGCFC